MGRAADIQKSFFWREFLYLWIAGASLIALSISLVAFPTAGLARQLFIPLHTQSAALVIIALILQDSIQLAIAVGVGLVAAHQVGLGAPILEAWLRKTPIHTHLRAPAIPIALTALLFVACAALANSSLFHPHRTQDIATANEILDSPAAEKVAREIDKLGLVGNKPITNFSMAVSDLGLAVDVELDARLFGVSVIVLLMGQIFGKPETDARWRYFFFAVLIVAVIRTAETLLIERENTLLFLSIFQSFGLPHRIDPSWLIVARTGVRVFPTAFALGLLYVRYGIESSIEASFCATVASHFFAMFWLMHFS
jgi:hypothetical protein